jgi:hypothetical protein
MVTVGTIEDMGEGGTTLLPHIAPIITQAGNVAWLGPVDCKNSVGPDPGAYTPYRGDCPPVS